MPATSNVPCPHCGSTMTEGTASLGTSAVGFALSGFSSQDLWFEAKGKRKCILTSSEQVAAFFCGGCGALSIPRKPSLSDKLATATERIARTLGERSRPRTPR